LRTSSGLGREALQIHIQSFCCERFFENYDVSSRIREKRVEAVHEHFSNNEGVFCSIVLLVYLPSCVGQETAKWLTYARQAASCYYQPNQSKIEAIPLSALPKETTSELASLSLHYPFFMQNVKQRSCEFQLLKSFDLTRPGNRTQRWARK